MGHQQYKINALLRIHSNNAYSKAPQYYVTRSLPILFEFRLQNSIEWDSYTNQILRGIQNGKYSFYAIIIIMM